MEDGTSVCGVVIRHWISISKIAVPLKACTAMATEIAGSSTHIRWRTALLHSKLACLVLKCALLSCEEENHASHR